MLLNTKRIEKKDVHWIIALFWIPGYISALDFEEIMKMARGHLLTPDVRDNLVAAAAGGSGGYRWVALCQ